jgi:hypothetical protein
MARLLKGESIRKDGCLVEKKREERMAGRAPEVCFSDACQMHLLPCFDRTVP